MKQINRLVITSRREGGADFLVRNDRLVVEDGSTGSYEAKLEKRRREAERQVQGWLQVEPLTEFRVEERSY